MSKMSIHERLDEYCYAKIEEWGLECFERSACINLVTLTYRLQKEHRRCLIFLGPLRNQEYLNMLKFNRALEQRYDRDAFGRSIQREFVSWQFRWKRLQEFPQSFSDLPRHICTENSIVWLADFPIVPLQHERHPDCTWRFLLEGPYCTYCFGRTGLQ